MASSTLIRPKSRSGWNCSVIRVRRFTGPPADRDRTNDSALTAAGSLARDAPGTRESDITHSVCPWGQIRQTITLQAIPAAVRSL